MFSLFPVEAVLQLVAGPAPFFLPPSVAQIPQCTRPFLPLIVSLSPLLLVTRCWRILVGDGPFSAALFSPDFHARRWKRVAIEVLFPFSSVVSFSFLHGAGRERACVAECCAPLHDTPFENKVMAVSFLLLASFSLFPPAFQRGRIPASVPPPFFVWLERMQSAGPANEVGRPFFFFFS